MLRTAHAKPRRILAPRRVTDDFGELSTHKHEAQRQAHALGHQMLPWHARPNDPHGRWNSYCIDCNWLAVVCVESPEGLDTMYGKALTEPCGRVLE
jgi:hypothetical protein